MDSPIIGDEDEDEKLSGRLVLTLSDEGETDNSFKETLSTHLGMDKPILETGKTWLSKLSSASSSATRNIRKNSLKQSDSDTECMASTSKAIGHWPDLLVMDKSENYVESSTKRIRGKN